MTHTVNDRLLGALTRLLFAECNCSMYKQEQKLARQQVRKHIVHIFLPVVE